jgi:acetolactate synthase-1/2/3 large subunit
MAGFVSLSWSFLCSDIHANPLLADLFYDRRFSHTRMTNPDFVLLAKAMGVHAIRVSSASELPEKMKEFLEYDGNRPVLLDCVIESHQHVYPLVCPWVND